MDKIHKNKVYKGVNVNINMKKRYNPFKMFGSYIGALVGSLVFAMNPIASYLLWMPKKDIIIFSGITFGLAESIIVGFLLGWIIHSLIRRLK